MASEKDTFYCSFVSLDCIICECGDNFTSEEDLKLHLEKEHIVKEKDKILVPAPKKPEPRVSKPEPQVSNVVVYSNNKAVIVQQPIYVIDQPIKEEPDLQYDACSEQMLSTLRGHLDEHHSEVFQRDGSDSEDFSVPFEETTIKYELPDQEQQEDVLVEYICPHDGDNTANPPGLYETIVTSKNQLVDEHNYDKDGADKEYYCDICGKPFLSKRAMSLHAKRIHFPNQDNGKRMVAKNKVCEICGKKYASNAALGYHQRVHTGEKPYPCTMCPKKFAMPLFLQIHIRTHTGERPYECQLCPKAFGNKAALLRHDRVHTGVKPYACPECNKTFTQSNSMKLHVRTVHLKLPAPYKSKARKMKELIKSRRKMSEVVFKVEESEKYDGNSQDVQYVVEEEEPGLIYEEVYSE